MKPLTESELIALIESGLSIIPITEGKKTPHRICLDEHGKYHLLNRRPTHEEIKKYFAAGVRSWAVAGGAVSGNLMTLDFDLKYYQELYDLWYAKLADDQKAIVATCVLSKTRNNGKHLRYLTEKPQPTEKLSRRIIDGELKTTSETKAQGGYALIPPSAGYEFVQGDLEHLPLVTDEMHESFIDILRTFEEVFDEPATDYEWKPGDTAEGDLPGHRLNALMSFKELIEPHGWVEEYKDGWRRPGKKKGEGISATTNWDGHPMLYVFSSAAAPFQQNRGYSKFHVFTLLNHGGDFHAAARAAAEMFPEKEDEKVVSIDYSNKFRLWTIGKILEHDFGEEEWIVEKLITKQGITAFSGNPGDYKTWLTIHIALCVSRGESVFGKFPTIQGDVLVIDEEDHIRLIKGRLILLGAKETDAVHYLSQSGFKADNKDALAAIIEIVREKSIKLVVLDSLVRIHDQEENDASGMSKVFSSIQKMIGAGASVLFTHHHRKQQGFGNQNSGQNMRGSSDILAAVDSHIAVDRKHDDKNNSLVITQTKSRQAEALVPFQLNIKKGPSGPSGFEYVGEYDEKKIKADSAAVSVVFLLNDGQKSRQEIIDALNGKLGKTSVEAGIKIAEAAGDIVRVPKEELPSGDRKAYYRLKETSSDEVDSVDDDLPDFQSHISVREQEDTVEAQA